MTDMSMSHFARSSTSREQRREWKWDGGLSTILGGVIVVGFPAFFWISLLELSKYVFALGISGDTRLIIASALVAMLVAIWSVILVAAHQRRSRELEAELQRVLD